MGSTDSDLDNEEPLGSNWLGAIGDTALEPAQPAKSNNNNSAAVELQKRIGLNTRILPILFEMWYHRLE
jgi:hypothetical protein